MTINVAPENPTIAVCMCAIEIESGDESSTTRLSTRVKMCSLSVSSSHLSADSVHEVLGVNRVNLAMQFTVAVRGPECLWRLAIRSDLYMVENHIESTSQSY